MHPVQECPRLLFILLAITGIGVSQAAEPTTSEEIKGPTAKTAEDASLAETKAHFDDQIAPLLARRCLNCHNGSEKKGGLDLSNQMSAFAGGESGRVIEPNNPAESLLWSYVKDELMPPKEALPDAEQELLRAWIASGATWGTNPIDPFRFTTEARAGYDWWALQPVEAVAPPQVESRTPIRNPIDQFIIARLAKQGLSQNQPADRRTLLRRLSFDLIGLPPSPEELEAFVSDERPDAYEREVDRLLASPHYGERWARHWLDIVRFGESHGFERDNLRENSWPYRDWVIAALNADMPYDEFCRRQMAGDVYHPQDSFALIATGFLAAGPLDEVGKVQQSLAMKAVVRQDELEDLVSVVGQTFLGLTVNCARCHDHKFDPIRQQEYYQLTAALAGVEQGERSLPSGLNAGVIKNLDAKRNELKQSLSELEKAARARLLAIRGEEKPTRPQELPKPLLSWDFSKGLESEGLSLPMTSFGELRQDAAGLHLDGQTAYLLSAPLDRTLKAKTLSAWVKLADLKQRGGGVIGIQTQDGVSFDSITYGEREPGQWVAGSNHFTRTQSFHGGSEREADKKAIHFAIVYGEDGTITGYRQGKAYGNSYQSKGPFAFEQGKSQIAIGLRHTPATGNRYLHGTVLQASVYDRSLSAEEMAALAGVEPEPRFTEIEIRAQLSPEGNAEYESLKAQLGELQWRRNLLSVGKTYAIAPQPPPATHLLHRGNPGDPREEVLPGGVASLRGVDADFGLKTNAVDGSRRKKLAEWITSKQNPLFARVMVNRLWHYHFGSGIVDTPSDFGFNGGRPSHPELLDWLASELIRSGWSLKHVHRLIVLSATYQQASASQSAAENLDAGNTLLWRKSRQRLDAESVRDALLAVAGELNLTMGGPGYRDFTTFSNNSQFYVPADPVGPRYNRRSIYRTWVRSGRNPFLDVFDCPDPSTKTPARAATTTPLQSLSMLNNSFVLRMAERCASRIEREAGSEHFAQTERLFLLCYGRKPDDKEIELVTPFVNQHGLAALCRVVFNSNEFLYVE